MKGKRLRQGQGHSNQQGRRKVDCVLVQFDAPPNWKSSAMLGLGALTFYSPSLARSLPSNLPKKYFYISRLEYPSHVSFPQSALSNRRALYSFYQRSLWRPQTVVKHPFLPTGVGWSSTQAACATCHNYPHNNILFPLSPAPLKDRILPQLPPFLLHHLPDF